MLSLKKVLTDIVNWRKENDDTGWIITQGTLGNAIRYRRKNGYVFLQSSTGTVVLEKNTWTIIGTLPQGFRPTAQLRLASDSNGSGSRGMVCYINTDGTIHLSTDVHGKYFNIVGCFPLG